MKYIILTLLIIIVIMASSCKKIFQSNTPDDILSLSKTNYTGNQLRIDGYYFQKFEDYLYPVFFYRDGIVQDVGAFLKSELSEREKEFKNGTFYSYSKNIKFGWGLFIIRGNKIIFERWYPSREPYRAYIREGEILNDSTFQITKSYRMQNGRKTEIRPRNEMYYFKQLSPKPDSTNNFIK